MKRMKYLEQKNLKKQETQDIFIKMNLTKLAFNLIWMADADFKDLPRGTSSEYVIHNETFDFAQN